jgi:HEAT repeat protein
MVTMTHLSIARWLVVALTVALVSSPAVAAEKAEAPAAAPWGPPAGGLAVSLTVEGDVAVGGRLQIKVALKSAAGQAVALPAAKNVFGWLLVGQGTGNARKAFYSEKVFPFREAGDWPAELAGEKVISGGPVNLAAAQAYASEDAKKLLGAYVAAVGPAGAEKPAEELPKPAGPMLKVLSAGRTMARFTLCLPNPGGPPTVLASNSVEIVIAPPDVSALSAEARQALIADLLKQFDRDAWSGRQAHDTAVRLGAAALEALIPAAMEKDRPPHARLWLATTVADIRDPRAAEALVKLLEDPSEGVRDVVAFYGPKQNSPDLDKAIIAKVQTSRQPGLAAWAILGFLVQRGTAPEEVLKAGLESDDPKARAAVAEALSQHASDANVARLVALLADKDERVRGTAAGVLGKSGVKSPAVVGALVKSLDLPGESARRRIAAALGELTGRNLAYDPAADPATRDKVIADWKAWWAKEGPKQVVPVP